MTICDGSVTNKISDGNHSSDDNNENGEMEVVAGNEVVAGIEIVAENPKGPEDKIEVITENPHCRKPTLLEMAKVLFIFGWTGFGGPTAHFALIHTTLVKLHNWISEETFEELLALCQSIPGPPSTTMLIAIGIIHHGVLGGLVNGALFIYPGLLIMCLAGFGAAKFLVDPKGWIDGLTTGLAAGAVALVANAAYRLGRKLCFNLVTTTLCIVSAVITFYYRSQWIFALLVFAGGITTAVVDRKKEMRETKENIESLGLSSFSAALTLFVWIALLVAIIIAASLTTYSSAKFIHWFKEFFFTGSVTYGGGLVVLPALENQIIQYTTDCSGAGGECKVIESPDTWITENQFMAGLALSQALPGPLINLAAYFGAIIGGVPGILAAWLGLFAPSIFVIYGILPFWGIFRKWKIYKRAMPGLNASAIGLIYAAVFNIGLKAYESSSFPHASVCIGFLSYWTNCFLPLPKKVAIFQAPLSILAGAVAGVIAWAAGCK